ncbi:YPR084W [Zygosaccharomyces parabailii]|uniref:ZYBA0S04-09846g1_1 n=1 Tax=Zygosaccharomyces bailii (strain CLIB 213 / ATCC 58445 / CBS 680 / BCRC 21525 / NBRC 1098 / NCYC 1416 / NRRL Y-2227) TaxID=1333698 RepID=A0A8J2T7Y4_ZYGB2|nr:YPR084W [Zygosaccharomyces parabailii]CDF89670.1 ZYBA0S04-09846g1_1 [Zygosaccharomyces bailii CLIB 213]CDH13793.1 uncharacterized protein ZBAI_05579 [Zygosaccharomyces bailii ISA1307]SJM87539.1 uncharacterized protein ZBIST_3728 [Zygosaccharomyces bailii]
MKEQRPIRLAVLGGDATGKSSFISRLTVNIVREVHYPTREQTNWLFDFSPYSDLGKTLLDRQTHKRLLRRTQGSQAPEPIFPSPSISHHVLLSPLVFQSFMNDFTFVKTQYDSRSTNHIKHINLKSKDTNLYQYLEPTADADDIKPINTLTNSDMNILRSSTSANSNTSDVGPANDVNIPHNYTPPTYTPIPIDIIDTPGFKPEMVVPFLEVSLFTQLDSRILKGLAKEPRKPVSTTSMLVASGASELNGRVDGYIFVYSAVPELNGGADPPQYEDSVTEAQGESAICHDQTSWSSFNKMADGGFSLLNLIRNCFLDAWTEFRNYQSRWEKGKESDVYSLVYNFKNLWRTEHNRGKKLAELRSFHTKLNSIDLDPSSPASPPPFLIVCTHATDTMASPKLVEWGRNLATQWKSGFVALDSMDDYNVDVAVSLILREIVERRKLTSQ